ncbi:hypothetical protein SAMN05880574_10631 [Chryseobacterium sp. RU37D]|uniref:energy transducer TonB n=1 Tax=Chryseobacterium sp. RU37D TaxID=1907397 RepID=UPI000956896A|nr:hypothetical protein [Chryseobacterium sp. RU37D]SIQ12329.1 hypothetical protein SAMN05880574_10631 [Chryseobacterium sp. RU37D]
MMKKIILCLFLFFGFFAFSQNTGIVDSAQVILEKHTDFPGGINTFRKILLEKFRIKKIISNKRSISCEAVFVVEKDGSISNIKATGDNESFNKEIVRTISKIKQKWIPAKYNGQIVRSRFRFPMKISFD